jgi:hydroxyacylglutathione hydrolase
MILRRDWRKFYRMFQRFFDEGLAQASFLVGCDRTRQAVVIDPRRDAAVYLEAARQHGATIVAAIETHVHADFVSGARELGRRGVRVITGPGAALQFEHHEAADGEALATGDLRLTALHTPGHTPEHVCVLQESAGQPARLFSGDLLFVGGVGRPDLLGEAQTRGLADQLFDSLRRVMALDERTEVHPGHGAGSLCGAGIAKDPASTIGRERRQNPMLQYGDRRAFVAALLADVPPTPPYFKRMKQLNAEGPALLESTWAARGLPAIPPDAAAALAADGALIVDLRSGEAFAAAHPDGAVSLTYGSKVGYWAGWVVPADLPLLLLADDAAQAHEAGMQLLRIGLDRVEGTIAGGFAAWTRAALPCATLEQISAQELRDAIDRHEAVQIVDVRSPREWAGGHAPGSINIPVGEIPARVAELRRDVGVATICESGYRSMLAASLLAQEGITHLATVSGGMAAFRALGEVTR